MKKYKLGSKTKKPEIFSKTEMERYLGALSETHNEHLKGIKEGFVIINRKLDSHSKILDSHSKTLDSHTEMIGSLAKDVSELKSDMKIVKEDISIVKGELKKKVDYDEFLSLVR